MNVRKLKLASLHVYLYPFSKVKEDKIPGKSFVMVYFLYFGYIITMSEPEHETKKYIELVNLNTLPLF